MPDTTIPTTQWWHSGTIYQVYPRSFRDSNGDGVGDLRGVIDKVDYLSWLGVDAVWLSPIYPSPHKDNGYDISDYQGVDPLFGTLSDLDELIDALHKRGIRLVMDLVVNHTSDQHPWFEESRSSPDSPKRDWYIWRPARVGTEPGAAGAEPTNWESYFSEPAWSLDPATAEYYLHLFAVEQPDLNWENPSVRDAVYSMMNWWLDRGVDGFRMDVINLISKRYPLTDGPIVNEAGRTSSAPSVNYGPRLDEYLREMYDEVFLGRDASLIRVGETPDVTIAQARQLSNPTHHELDLVFQFEHVGLDREPTDWKRPRALDPREIFDNLIAWQEGLAQEGWNSLYWSNHDQPRTVSRFGDDSGVFWADSAKTLATVLYCMRGTAFVYQGDEIGMTNFPFESLEEFADISSVNYIRHSPLRDEDPERLLGWLQSTARDNARTPMQWTSGPLAGFTDGTAWFPLNPASGSINVEAQQVDPDSVLAHYRRLIAARKSLPPLAVGDFHRVESDALGVVAYERIDGAARARVVANVTSRIISSRLADRPAWAETTMLAVGSGDRDGELAPWQSVVWTNMADS